MARQSRTACGATTLTIGSDTPTDSCLSNNCAPKNHAIEQAHGRQLSSSAELTSLLSTYQTGETADTLRCSQTVIELAGGDPTKGTLIVGSPLAVALVLRGLTRWSLGRAGWRGDLDDAVAMARSTDPVTHAMVVGIKYGAAIVNGVLEADDRAVREIEEALQIAEGFGDDFTLAMSKHTLGFALVRREGAADRQRGLELLAQVRDMCQHLRFPLSEIPILDIYAARERARCGDCDGAIPVMRKAAEDIFQARQLTYCVAGTGVLVETLLDRGAEGDATEAQDAADRLENLPAREAFAVRDITLLRLRALLARARGDEVGYRDFRDRYRDMARTLGFEGHIAWAEAMT